MARPLTPDELARYPWASQISDYMPVGRLRKSAVYFGLAGLTILLIGAIFSLAEAQNIHSAVPCATFPPRSAYTVAWLT